MRTGSSWQQVIRKAWLVWCSAAMVALIVAACNNTSSKEPVKTQPSDLPPPAMPGETMPESPTETQPATAPAAKPESTYGNEPPYPVALYVESADDKQPGWLKVEQLADDSRLATVKGRFPERNRIYVDTTNVRSVRIHVGHLPLAPNERVILQIDQQGMVLSRKNPFVTLDRLHTGEWVVKKEKGN